VRKPEVAAVGQRIVEDAGAHRKSTKPPFGRFGNLNLPPLAESREAPDKATMAARVFTLAEVMALVRKAAGANRAAWARRHMISASYLSDVLNGHRPPGDAILKALGLERVTAYRRRRRPKPQGDDHEDQD
jgi:hypothetical protein